MFYPTKFQKTEYPVTPGVIEYQGIKFSVAFKTIKIILSYTFKYVLKCDSEYWGGGASV